MKYSFIGWVSLTSLCSATSFPYDTDIWQRDPQNLRQLLEWSQAMANADFRGNKIYSDFLWGLSGGIFRYRKVQKSLHSLFETTRRLARLLLSRAVIDNIPPCTDKGAILNTFYAIVEMEDVFNDLLDHIKQWERESEGTNKVLIWMTPKQYEWFEKNGFNRCEMHSLTIKAVKHVVCNIYGENKPLNFLLHYYGTVKFHQPQPLFSSRLASLVVMSISNDLHDILERYLIRPEYGMPHNLTIELVEALKGLSSQQSPIWFLNGVGRHQGMFTWYLELYKYVLFHEINASLYMEMITTACQTVEKELAQLAENMMKDEIQYTVYFSEEPVFILGHNIADYLRHIDKVIELIKEDGPITKLCQAVRNYTGYTNTRLPTIDSTINPPPAKRMRLLHMTSVKDPVNEFSNVAV